MILGNDPQSVTRELAEQVVENYRAWKAGTGAKDAQVAKSMGISSTTLSQVLSFTYNGCWQQMVIDLDRWLDDQKQREAAPKLTEFVRTGIAEDIFAVADAAVALETIGVIFGPAGIGKTLALKAIRDEKPGSIYISMQTAATSKLGVIEAVANELRICTVYRNKSTRIYLQQLREILGASNRLLIVDEIHKLFYRNDDDGLHVLRDLHDQTGIPMVWCSTSDPVAYLDRRQGIGREPLSQIRSRIGICRDLTERSGGDGGGEPLFTIDEIRKIFSRAKMRLTPDAARYLVATANIKDSGGLRICKRIMVMAVKIHERSHDTLTGEMLKSAHRLLLSRRLFSAVQDRMDTQAPLRAAVG